MQRELNSVRNASGESAADNSNKRQTQEGLGQRLRLLQQKRKCRKVRPELQRRWDTSKRANTTEEKLSAS